MWTAYLYQVTSGNIGARLNFSDLSWNVDLNETETIRIVLPKSDLPDVDLSLWLEPTWAGVVVLWNNVPVVAGPILSRSNETMRSITLDCRGIRAILARRLAIKELTDWSGLNKSSLAYSGMSLGTIAKRVVRDSTQPKPGGSLPISYPIADELVANDANHQRTYRGFNLSNISVDQILTKISEVTNGPDIMFRPRLLRDNQLTFDMWHGTERQPRIYQNNMPVWDTTAEKGEVSDISIITTGAYMTQRVFSMGAGIDEGKLITVSFDGTPLTKQFPLLETVIQTSDSENSTVVKSHGNAKLYANLNPLKEIQMTVRGDGINPFGTFWPGETCEVILSGWIALKDGKYRMRILSMSGDDSSEVKLSLQLA